MLIAFVLKCYNGINDVYKALTFTLLPVAFAQNVIFDISFIVGLVLMSRGYLKGISVRFLHTI